MSWLSVSIIIPTFNAENTISDTLSALEGQTYQGPIEIIVVDDGSTDATKKVVERYPSVKYIFQSNAGPASARNFGVRNSSGELLVFTDADCRPRREWVEKMVNGFSSTDIAVVAGSYGIANPRSWLARVIHAEIKYRHHALMPDFPKAFGSYNFAIRRTIFEEVGGFNFDYRRASGEDNDLSYKILRIGKRIRFLRDVVVDHYHPTNLKKYMRDQFRHGIWRVRMYVDHPGMAIGDDYTFWKDIVEVPAAFLSLGVLFFPYSPYAWGYILLFLAMEFFFGIRMISCSVEGWGAGVVFFLRAYARTAGFLVGVGRFIIYLIKIQKKYKIPLRHY